jgi:hypothetical protein
LKGFSARFVPQNLLFVSTLVTYLAAFATESQSSILSNSLAASRVGSAWGLAVSVILIQLFSILSSPECTPEPIGTFSGMFRALLAIALGMAAGGGAGYGFATASWTQPTYNTGDPVVAQSGLGSKAPNAKTPGFVREQFQLGAGLGEMPAPPAQAADAVPVDMAKSSGAVTPGDSSDQFVCEAYKNGQLVSSTLS